MLTQLEVFTPGVTTAPLPVTSGTPSTDPLQIRNIDGLEPVKADVNTSRYGSVDGEFYISSSVGKRNIVITIGLNPNWADQTYEALRKILYLYFMPKTQVTLKFTSTHMPPVQISGYVESCEPSIFSKDPEMQVSIICNQPYFEAISASALSGTTTALTDNTTTDVDYPGDIPVGFIMDISADSGGTTFTNSEVRIINTTPTLQFYAVVATVDSTKFLRVSTVQGDKYVKQYPLPSGTPTNILGKATPGNIWWPLQKGINKIKVQVATPGQSWSIHYFARYGGL